MSRAPSYAGFCADIRLEDTIVVTDTGADNLTAAVPAEVDPLYALIRQKGGNSAPLTDRASR